MDVSSSEQGLSFGFLFACILTSMIHCSSFFPQKNISIFQGSLPASVTAVVVAAYDCFGDLRTNSFVFLSLGLQFIRYLCMWVSVSCGGRCSGGGGGGPPPPPPPPKQNCRRSDYPLGVPLNKLDQRLEAIVLSTSTLNTYPNSSLSSFLAASKGTFRTSILELFCFVAVAELRCDTLSLKMK